MSKKGFETDRDEHRPEYDLKGTLPFGVDGAGTARSLTVNTSGNLITGDVPSHDTRMFTYVAAGNGAGEVETITYKTGGTGGTTVRVRTFTYDASDRVSTMVDTDS